MGLRIIQVDAFTDKAFAGNPAAVCVLSEPGEAGWMQNVATEMNLSETAFLVPQEDGFDLRWFTPTREVDLCGHATLASAHVLWEEGHLSPNQQARFHTRSGLLTADRDGDWIVMDFPAEPATKIGHPAPFPIELPYRLIQLYTFKGDIVIDPFMGSGQTALAALKASRHYLGYEINPEYVSLAEARIKAGADFES